MVYNIKKSSGAPLVSIPDSSQDTTTTSLILPGRNSVSFGLSINQNFVDLLQNFANTSSPPSPQQGQIWYDSVNLNLKVYDGNKWIAVMSGFNGSAGVTSMRIGTNNTDVDLLISQYQIISVVSADRVEHGDCPDSVIFNDISYAFSARFPNGLFPGINLATDPAKVVSYVLNGVSTYANVLVNSRTVNINGAVYGSFRFNGSSDVNVTIRDSNVYVGNTNVTVAGTWSKVLVGDTGRVLAGNNLTSGDIVTALGYTPYNGANIDVNATPNTVVARDSNANFASNVIVAETVLANQFLGTASNAVVLANTRNIYVSGDLYGNVQFDGSSDVVLYSNLSVQPSLTAGSYNLVNVDAKGRVTRAAHNYEVPLGGVILYTGENAPAGYSICDGRISTDTVTGLSVTTPDLRTIWAAINVPNGISVKYIMRTYGATLTIPAGDPSVSPAITIKGTTITAPDIATTSVGSDLSGGPSIEAIAAGFSNINIGTVGQVSLNRGESYSNTTFMDTLYFNAIAFIMGLGDSNGIMFSKYDDWKNLESLTVQDVIDNLHQRALDNLPAFVGKYMLPLSLIKQQVINLSIPTNYPFSPLLQDQLVSSITSNFSHQLNIAGIAPTDEALFLCHYFGSASAFIALTKGNATVPVTETLHSSGYYTNFTSNLNNYNKVDLARIMAEILQIAKQEINHRLKVDQDTITCGQYVSSDGNTIVTTSAVNGYKIGNNNLTDQQGGYFPEYDSLSLTVSSDSSVNSPTVKGSAGTVTIALEDAGACALAGVLQTENTSDQSGQAQLVLNRLGATLTNKVDFGSKNGFDIATSLNAFTALSAAINGANNDAAASTIYSDLHVNRNALREALKIADPNSFKISLLQLFTLQDDNVNSYDDRRRLSDAQLDRIYQLRADIYRNGPDISAAQVAIGGALNSVPPSSDNIEGVVKPFGENTYGYVTSSVISGFFVSNTSDAAASSPAPSPEALLDRVRNHLLKDSDLYTVGTITYSTPGVYEFVVPPHRNSVSINGWGGGGGGGASSSTPGYEGGTTTVTIPGIGILTATGGGGGQPGYYRRGMGASGPGGNASGGSSNLPGSPGSGGWGNNYGGSAPYGGQGGGNSSTGVGGYTGNPGGAPGGGGSGGSGNDGSKYASFQAGGGGGSGGYVELAPTKISRGTTIVVNVAAGASGTGSTGGDGKVIISWN